MGRRARAPLSSPPSDPTSLSCLASTAGTPRGCTPLPTPGCRRVCSRSRAARGCPGRGLGLLRERGLVVSLNVLRDGGGGWRQMIRSVGAEYICMQGNISFEREREGKVIPLRIPLTHPSTCRPLTPRRRKSLSMRFLLAAERTSIHAARGTAEDCSPNNSSSTSSPSGTSMTSGGSSNSWDAQRLCCVSSSGGDRAFLFFSSGKSSS